MIGSGTNALASSIVLVCRQRPERRPTATRREFVARSKPSLPHALPPAARQHCAGGSGASGHRPRHGGLHPLYQSARRRGQAITVRAALALINQTLDEALAEQEGDFDADTRWALTWFEQFGFAEGDYGVAEHSRSPRTPASRDSVEAGIVVEGWEGAACCKPEELPADWDPATDKRLTVWEIVHHLIRVLEAAAKRSSGTDRRSSARQAETARELCLPPLHALRAQEACSRAHGLQRAGAKLARDHAPGREEAPANDREPAPATCSSRRISHDGHHQPRARRQGAWSSLKAGLAPVRRA
jgi:putative DNA methylase